MPQYIEPLIFPDDRGSLSVLIERPGLVFKTSVSKAGVFRGLHIQVPPYQQEKYIRVKEGSILDVCLDLNPSSPDFGCFFYYDLEPSDSFFDIPAYFAHGFLCQTDTKCEYLCLGSYCESSEVVISPPASIAQRVGFDLWSQCTFSEKDENGLAVVECLQKFSRICWD